MNRKFIIKIKLEGEVTTRAIRESLKRIIALLRARLVPPLFGGALYGAFDSSTLPRPIFLALAALFFLIRK